MKTSLCILALLALFVPQSHAEFWWTKDGNLITGELIRAQEGAVVFRKFGEEFSIVESELHSDSEKRVYEILSARARGKIIKSELGDRHFDTDGRFSIRFPSTAKFERMHPSYSTGTKAVILNSEGDTYQIIVHPLSKEYDLNLSEVDPEQMIEPLRQKEISAAKLHGIEFETFQAIDFGKERVGDTNVIWILFRAEVLELGYTTIKRHLIQRGQHWIEGKRQPQPPLNAES